MSGRLGAAGALALACVPVAGCGISLGPLDVPDTDDAEARRAFRGALTRVRVSDRAVRAASVRIAETCPGRPYAGFFAGERLVFFSYVSRRFTRSPEGAVRLRAEDLPPGEQDLESLYRWRPLVMPLRLPPAENDLRPARVHRRPDGALVCWWRTGCVRKAVVALGAKGRPREVVFAGAAGVTRLLAFDYDDRDGGRLLGFCELGPLGRRHWKLEYSGTRDGTKLLRRVTRGDDEARNVQEAFYYDHRTAAPEAPLKDAKPSQRAGRPRKRLR